MRWLVRWSAPRRQRAIAKEGIAHRRSVQYDPRVASGARLAARSKFTSDARRGCVGRRGARDRLDPAAALLREGRQVRREFQERLHHTGQIDHRGASLQRGLTFAQRRHDYDAGRSTPSTLHFVARAAGGGNSNARGRRQTKLVDPWCSCDSPATVEESSTEMMRVSTWWAASPVRDVDDIKGFEQPVQSGSETSTPERAHSARP